MIIYYLYVVSIPISPLKANPPLLVNPNTMLAFEVMFESFQAVSRRGSQITKVVGVVHHLFHGQVQHHRTTEGMLATLASLALLLALSALSFRYFDISIFMILGV